MLAIPKGLTSCGMGSHFVAMPNAGFKSCFSNFQRPIRPTIRVAVTQYCITDKTYFQCFSWNNLAEAQIHFLSILCEISAISAFKIILNTEAAENDAETEGVLNPLLTPRASASFGPG